MKKIFTTTVALAALAIFVSSAQRHITREPLIEGGRKARMKRVALAVALLLLLAPVPARAIIGGEIDGDRHPNVGIVVTFEEGGGGQVCSGTLISPTVMVTAAHCVKQEEGFPPIELILVSFDSVLPFDPFLNAFVIRPAISATPFGHPDFVNGPVKSGVRGFLENAAHDIGVLILDQPASTIWPGITPAPLPTAGALDQFRTGTRNRLFTIVGYGTHRDIEPPKGHELLFDATRRMTTSPLKNLTDTLLILHGVANDARGGGEACNGDSGGPVFLEEVLVGVTSFGSGGVQDLCEGATDGRVRLDAEIARDFLGNFVTLP